MNGFNLGLGNWLPDMDLNHDKQIQSLLCYRYTIGQSKLCKGKGWLAGVKNCKSLRAIFQSEMN